MVGKSGKAWSKFKIAIMEKKDRIIYWTNDFLSELSVKNKNLGIELLKNNGRKCCEQSSLYQKAKSIRNKFPDNSNDDVLFNSFKEQFYNSENLQKNGNEITLIFEECTCDRVKEGVSHPFLCNCTVGYTHQIFETLFNKKVNVKLEKSILRGDKICQQKIYS